jgi:hypothetical protein
MLRLCTVVALLIAPPVSLRAQLDLTAAVTEYEAGGFKHRQLNFQHNQSRVQYELPHGWTFRSEPRRIELTPPEAKFAKALIEATPVAPPQALDTNAIRERFVAEAPPGSQEIKLEEEGESPVQPGGYPSFQITISYQTMGEKFLKRAIFVNLPDTQLVFRFTSRKDDFEALFVDFKRSIMSWQVVENEPAVTAPPAATVPAVQATAASPGIR